MKSLALIGAILLSTSCIKLTGKMDVVDHVVFKKNGKTDVLLAGNYEATVTLKRDNKIVLRAQNQFEKKKMSLTLPKGSTLPTTEGEFTYTSTQLGQPFDLVGAVKTEVKKSDLVETTESCRVYVGYDYCGPIGNGGFGNGRAYCGPDSLPGTRNVKFQLITTTKRFVAKIAQKQVEKAQFTGENVDVKKDYLHVGVCRL